MTVQHIFEGIGAPAYAPASKGAHYIDTSTGELYLAKGTATPADWVRLSDAVATAQALLALQGDLSSHIGSLNPHTTLGNVSYVTFNTAAAVSVGEAQMAWNTTDKTVDLGLPGGSVLQIGQELLVRVLNNTGSPLASGDMVYITGASGQRLTVAKATPSVGARTLAMVTQSIANNQEGMATVTGLVRDFNTSAFADGAELWLHPTTPGALTATRPSAPTRQILVGYCVRSHAVNGSLFVNVRATGSLASATSDVTITAPAAGQVLRYNGSVWANATPLESIIVACSDETTALTAGTAKVTFRMPYAFTLTGVRAALTTAQASGSILTVDLNEAGVSVLSTKLTIDNGEKTSTTAATAAVISDSALADDAEMTVDIDQIGDGTAKGLKVTLLGYRP